VGALPSFIRDPLATLRRAAEKGDVCHLELGFADVVTLNHPEHADHVLRRHQRNYPKGGSYWAGVRGILGKGLPTSEGSLWLRQRRMMQPHFHRQRLEALTSLIVDALDRSLRWSDIDTSFQVLDIGARMPLLTMNVVSAAMLGSRTSSARAAAFGREFDFAIDHIFRGMLAQVLPRWVPIPGRQRFGQAVDRMHRLLMEVIETRRRETTESADLLAMLIAATDDETGEGMSDEQLLDEVTSLFLAGYETTASGLQWALHFLAEHPWDLACLRDEVDATLRGAPPRFDDLPSLRYARWVIQEALRLYPPAWWLPRVATEDDEIGGFPIPAGTMVAPIVYTIQRHPEIWPQPERFDPERHDRARAAARHPLAWMPFGAGLRQCIGRELALMEATMALAMITQRYEIESVGHVTRARLHTVIRPANGVVLRVRRRRPAQAWARVTSSPSSRDSSSSIVV